MHAIPPSLMLEVCLVLAPDVNFFLNSRKQGLPCWRSLILSLLHPPDEGSLAGCEPLVRFKFKFDLQPGS